MAAPTLTGWLAPSDQTHIWSTEAFAESPGYPRAAVHWSGSPAMDTQPRLDATADAPAGQLIRHLGVFDDPASGKGYCIALFKALPEYTETPASLPATSLMITAEMNILGLSHSALYAGVSAETGEIQRGALLGRCNGRPLHAGVRLVCSDGRLCRPGALSRRPTLVSEASA